MPGLVCSFKFINAQALRYYNHLNYYFHADSMAVAKLIINRGQIHGAIYYFIIDAQFGFNANVKPFLLFSFNRAPADNVAISLHRLDCWSLMVLLADMAPLSALIRAAGF